MTVEVDRVIDDAIGIRAGVSRADIVESRGGWAAIRADAAVALLNGTARTNVVSPAEVDLSINADAHDQHQSVSEATETPAGASPTAEGTSPGDGDAGLGDRASVSEATETPAGALPVDDLDFGHWGRAVAPMVGRRRCCEPQIAVLIEDCRGTVLGAGRRTRLVSRKLRRALERRDSGCCGFPGCAATLRLHAHHITHWADGGLTELDNLILLCAFHHHTVHEGGWRIDPVTHAFITPAGTPTDNQPATEHGGNARMVTAARRFTSLAPLAEAENQPFDVGLVLEGLAFNNTESAHKAEAVRHKSRASVEFRPAHPDRPAPPPTTPSPPAPPTPTTPTRETAGVTRFEPRGSVSAHAGMEIYNEFWFSARVRKQHLLRGGVYEVGFTESRHAPNSDARALPFRLVCWMAIGPRSPAQAPTDQ